MSSTRPHRAARRALRVLVPLPATAAAIACLGVAPAAARTHVRSGLAEQLAPVHRHLSRPLRTARRHAGRRHDHRRRSTGRRAHASSAGKLLVLVDLTHLRRRGAISRAAMRRDRHIYLQALRTLGHLSSTSRTELADVLANVREIAAQKGLTASRLPALMQTVRRNREWWSEGSPLSYGQRVSFPGSRLLWEYYPGQGIELQWLATFGEANGYYLSGDQNGALEQVLEEAEELATVRAGGIAWEYMFHFDGGSPPWTSGLAQGTAVQAFARGAQRLHEPRFLQDAGRALGLFETPPPAGVRALVGDGVEYLEYSFAPKEHILNGFIQALTGLYDYAKIAGSQTAARLFEAGDAQARSEVPQYDTGAWSMYDQHTESDLGYHELLTQFLHNLCERTGHGPPVPATPPGTPSGGAEAAPQPGGAEGEGEAGAGAAGGGSEPAQEAIPGDEIYCKTAEDFEGDLHTAPAIKLLSHRLPAGARAGVMLSLSKVSTVTITVRKGREVVWSNQARVEAGKPRLLWVTPKHGGRYEITATAVDLAGNRASTTGNVRLTRGHGHRHGHGTRHRRRHRRGHG